MAKQVIKAGYLSLGAVDYSALVESVELQVEADEGDVTTMGSAGWHEGVQGIKRGTLAVTMKNDADLSGFDAALWTAFTGAGTLAFEVRRDQAAVSTTNPKYTGTVVATQAGINLQVGQVFGRQYSFPVTGAITRATA